MVDKASVYKIYNTSELHGIEAQLREQLSNWISHWYCTPEKFIDDVQVIAANAFDSDRALQCFVAKDGILANNVDAEGWLVERGPVSLLIFSGARARLLENLLGYPVDNVHDDILVSGDYCPATQKLLETAIAALAPRLNLSVAESPNSCCDDTRFLNAEKVLNSPALQPKTSWRIKGRGWVYLDIEVGGVGVSALLAPQAATGANKTRDRQRDIELSRNSPCAPAKEALVDQQLKLQAELGSIDLSIGDFRSLKSGDVLRLNTNFADTVVLKTTGGEIVCRGLLGKSDGRRAVKII